MKTLEFYLNEYAESHRHPTNVTIHSVCVPTIMWSLLAFLATYSISDSINAGHVFAVLSLIYYASFKHPKLILSMTAIVAIMFYSFTFIPNLRAVAIAVFVLSWIAQFYGHKVEGKKPSFFKDLQFLLIGPVWVIKKFAPRFI